MRRIAAKVVVVAVEIATDRAFDDRRERHRSLPRTADDARLFGATQRARDTPGDVRGLAVLSAQRATERIEYEALGFMNHFRRQHVIADAVHDLREAISD